MQGIGIIRACLTVIKFTIGVIKTLIGYIKKVISYIYQTQIKVMMKSGDTRSGQDTLHYLCAGVS